MRQRLSALALVVVLTLGGASLATAAPAHQAAPAPSRVGSRAASFALAYVGYRYAYVGDTPYTGFSCVGFVHWVYANLGYSTPENTYSLSALYPHVSAANLVPGDVLLFANTFYPGLSHAAIYIGNGLMVGADNFYVGVHVDSVWDAYWGPRFVTGLRIAPYWWQAASSAPTQVAAAPTARVVARVQAVQPALRVALAARLTSAAAPDVARFAALTGSLKTREIATPGGMLRTLFGKATRAVHSARAYRDPLPTPQAARHAALNAICGLLAVSRGPKVASRTTGYVLARIGAVALCRGPVWRAHADQGLKE